uniref:Phosphopantetheine attachment site n=1 Tax=Candidatus Kentrum sp. TUN TaxID=2126343 RepID=A0A451A7L4_9GAMM|nr:MAG: Phosphopantetheine attachment site [Candidatus Kentron sp. TUN]VFK71214.1 MAG: Phosphopantetheine attachment site [Candidatus Kentron sp. TUN]
MEVLLQAGDWRVIPKESLQYKDINLPESMVSACMTLTGKLGLNFAAIDLLEINGDYYFLEVNPTGEWEEIEEKMPPLRGIIHAAGFLDDGVLVQQSMARFEKVMAPKVAGSWHLHTLTQEIPLDFFVCFSSVASLFGASGQGNYVAANAFMDALAHYRHAMGLPALSINWGAWANIGLAANLDSQQQARLAAMGIDTIEPERGISRLNVSMGQTEVAQVSIAPTNWSRYLKQFSVVPIFLSELMPTQSTMVESIQVKHRLEQASEEEYERILVDFIRSQLAGVLGTNPSQLDMVKPLNTMRLDSLMAVELRNRIRSDLDIEISLAKLVEGVSVLDLARQIENRLVGSRSTSNSSEDIWATDILLPFRSITENDKPPLFCIHPIGGGVFHYRELADCLPNDQPVYGIQAVGFEGEASPLTDITAMAIRYVEKITMVWPNGPYDLYGWSFGGIIALEVAHSLQSDNREAVFVNKVVR